MPSSIIFQPSPSLGDAVGLEPDGLVPRERHVELGHVDLLARVGDAGLGVDVVGALQAGRGPHRVAAGEARRLGARRRAEDPRRRATVGRGRLAAGLVGEHHRAGAVGRGAGLEEADRLPHHRADAFTFSMEMSSIFRWAYGFFSAFSRSLTATFQPMCSGAPLRWM